MKPISIGKERGRQQNGRQQKLMLRRSLSGLAALAALLLLGTGNGQAGVEPTPFQESPLLGGGLGQTLRITITGTGDLCEATLGFRDIQGQPIPDDGHARTVILKRGESAFHDLNFNAFVRRLGQRYEARAVVTHPPEPVRQSCRWSAEIFDQFTQRTTVIYSPEGDHRKACQPPVELTEDPSMTEPIAHQVGGYLRESASSRATASCGEQKRCRNHH